MELFLYIVYYLAQALNLLVLVYVVLGWVMPPYHPIRQALGRIVEPFLEPIRQILPQMGMMDFSPIVLFLILSFIERLIVQTLS